MDILSSRDEHGLTLSVDRSLDRTNGRELDRALQTHIATGEGPLWLHVGGLQFVDSAGLTVLLRAHRLARERGVAFALVGLTDYHRKLLEITRLDRELLVFDEPGGVRVTVDRERGLKR